MDLESFFPPLDFEARYLKPNSRQPERPFQKFFPSPEARAKYFSVVHPDYVLLSVHDEDWSAPVVLPKVQVKR